MRTKKTCRNYILISAISWLLLFCGCGSANNAETADERHMAMVSDAAGNLLYLDRVACKTVMREIDSMGTNAYSCFLVGMVVNERLQPNGNMQAVKLEEGKYFQFDMYRDWSASISGDSIQPVFFHPKISIDKNRREGILIFEHLKGLNIDELVYKDTYGSWGTKRFEIKN